MVVKRIGTRIQRRLYRLGLEATTTIETLRSRGSPRVMFFPWSIPEASSLLRAYKIAEALRGMGWSAVVVPIQLSPVQRRRLMARFQPDVVVVQKSRHSYNEAAYFEGVPFIYDIDDADFCLDSRVAAREEAVARAAKGVIAGSRFIAEWYSRFNPCVETIWTGGPVRSGERRAHAARAPILTWAQSDPLAYRHEFDFVAAAAIRVHERRGTLKLRLYGWRAAPDHPLLVPMRARGIELELLPPMPYERFVSSLEECAVGLSPVMVESDFSRGKSFGKILAYLDAKVPVICSDEVDHRDFFEPGSGVVSNDISTWVAEACRLLDEPRCRDAMADAAFVAYRARLSTEAAALKVDAFLRRSFGL